MLAVRMRMRTGFLDSELKTGGNLDGNDGPNQGRERIVPFRINPKEEIGEPLQLRYPYGRNETPYHIPDGGHLAK